MCFLFSCSIQTLLVQVKCFQEIISIGYQVYRIHGLPWFRSLSWYFLLTSNYFFYGENLVDYFGVVINRVVSAGICHKKKQQKFKLKIFSIFIFADNTHMQLQL